MGTRTAAGPTWNRSGLIAQFNLVATDRVIRDELQPVEIISSNTSALPALYEIITIA